MAEVDAPRCTWINVPAGSRVCVTVEIDGDATACGKWDAPGSDPEAGDITDEELTDGWCHDVPDGGALTIEVCITWGGDEVATATVHARVQGPATAACDGVVKGQRGAPDGVVTVIAAS